MVVKSYIIVYERSFFMPDYIKFPNHINETLRTAINSICQTQKTIYDAMAPTREIQASINRMMRPYQEISKVAIPNISLTLTEFSNNISKEMINALRISLDASVASSELTENIRRIIKCSSASSFAGAFKKCADDLPERQDNYPDNDFVIADEAAIKTYDLSDDIAISVGNNRIKISTSNFIALISLITQLIFGIISMLPSSPTETETKQMQAEETQIILLQSQNQILRDLFHNIDLSSSSQAEVLQSLKESVEAQNTAISDLEESVDLLQQSLDNTSESENTEAEN